MNEVVLLWLLAAALMAAGIAGMVLPFLPGAPLLFAGFLLAAWAENFAYIGAATLTVLGVLAALTYALDFAATAFGAKRFGATPRAAVGAALGTLLGLPLGLVGVIVGPFIGAFVAELSGQRGLRAAGRAGLGASLGLAIGAAAKLALGFVMIGIFVVARFL